jgi:hypothetical protein
LDVKLLVIAIVLRLGRIGIDRAKQSKVFCSYFDRPDGIREKPTSLVDPSRRFRDS